MDADNKQRVDSAKADLKNHRDIGDKLSEFLNRLANNIEDIDRDKRLALFRKQIKAHQYMDGNFYGYVDQNCQWQSRPRASDEVWYSDNQLYPYLRTALMELSRTQTEVVINAPPGASDDLIAAAKFAKARYDANRDRTFNARLKQTENTYALLNGITFRYTFAQFGGRKERIPKLREQDNPEASKLCAMCSRPILEAIEGKEKCTSCGSEMFLDVKAGPDTIIGYEDLDTCQNLWIVPNPVGIIVSLQASCIEESPFIKWKQLILRSVLQAKFKGMELPSTGTESLELRYITNQQKATPASDTSDALSYEARDEAGRELEVLEFQQTWLDYSVYCEKKFDDDMPLGRGKTLKAGKTLGSAYPKGLYFARVGDLILDIWNEDKNRKWTSSPYGMRPGSMYGSGSHTALSDQEIINDIRTITMANAWANGVPKEFVDPNVITEISSDPQIPTNADMSGQVGNIIGRGYQVAPPMPLSSEIYALSEKSEAAMQNKIGAMSNGAGGLSDSQKWGDTATAISIKRDLAVGRFSPDLELMAYQLDVEQAKQFLANEQEFFTPSQWNRVKGDYGDDALKAFLDCDIKNDLIVTITPGSHMPKSDAQVQAKLVSYAQILPMLAQIQNPELIAYASEVFGIPETLAGWNSDKAHAQKVVRRFEALTDLFIEQYGDLPTASLEPIVGADGQSVPSPARLVAEQVNEYSRMPVDIFLDNHEAIIDSLRDWRATDDGRDASNALLASVDLRLLMHQEGIAKQGQVMARTEMAKNEPVEEKAQEEQAKMLEAQTAQQAAAQDEAETQMQAQAADKLMEHADRDDARAHEAQMQQEKLDHEKDIEAVKLLASEPDPAHAENKEN